MRPDAATGTSWWRTLYDDLLAEVLLERSDEERTTQTLDFLVQHLALKAGAAVMDQCCGIGSLSIPLADRGFDVLGLDQAAGYIERAAASVGAASRARFVTGDAFEFCPEEKVQAVFNWWTSFGYAPDDATNERMLARAFDALVPGGRFALDYMNVPGVLRHFQPRVELVRETPLGTVTLVRLSELDLPRGVMSKRWVFTLPDGRVEERPSSVRLYSPDRVLDMLGSVGFVASRVVGDIDGQPLGLDSPRAIFLAQRPL